MIHSDEMEKSCLQQSLETRTVEECRMVDWTRASHTLAVVSTMSTSVLTYEDCVSCLSSSPKQLLLGLYTGHITMDDMSQRNSVRVHKNPCRVVVFHDGQSRIISGSSKGHLGIVDAERFVLEKKIKVGKSAVSALLSLDTHKIVCGDDDGGIFVYDFRKRTDGPVVEFLNIHDDHIIKLLNYGSQNNILSISGNGVIGMIDIRKHAQSPQTTSIDEEILSCCQIDSPDMQSSERVLLATDSGSLVYYTGHPQQQFSRRSNHKDIHTNGMVSIDSETVLLGCEDGSVHSLNVSPNSQDDPTPLHSIDGSIENIVFLPDKQTICLSTMSECVYTFPYLIHQSNLGSIQPRNFFDDLME